MPKIRVPATSANLGPGFDCLGLALDLWNTLSFEPAETVSYQVTGEGAYTLNNQPANLLTSAMRRLYDACDRRMEGVRITSDNRIPLSSGLGSSAAAIVAGLAGANELLERPVDPAGLLKLAAEIEGHPDNVAAALLGGLVVSVTGPQGAVLTRQFQVPDITAVVVKPNVDLSTEAARAVLPALVLRADAVFNIGRAPLVVDALQRADLDLLRQAMDDRLHQSYRLEHIPAGREAFETARSFGAAALSGAGPSMIVFVEPVRAQAAQAAITGVFSVAGIQAHGYILHTSNLGAQVI